MAPPKTDLPFVINGMIWDGVTAYSDALPPGVGIIYLLRMYGDGTRRFSESFGSAFPGQQLLRQQGLGWDPIGVTYANPDHPTDYRNGGFLQYDGSLSFDPPNQYFELNAFRAHAARFAHQLDAAMGHHTLAAAEERDRLATYNTLADLIGNAWRRFQEWYDIDPQEIISGGNFDGTLLWKRDIDEYRSVHDYLCGECDIATFARRFILNANLDLFRRIYRQGLVYATNRDVTPWEPRFIDVATSPQSSFYEQLRVDYHLALTHYDHVIGVQDVRG